MRNLRNRLFVTMQYLLPRYLVTRLFYRLTRVRLPLVRDFLIRRFVTMYPVNVGEAARAIPDGYRDFNDFFTRELRDNARTVTADIESIVSPVDGTVSAAGRIRARRIFQAKGKDYSLDEFLSTDLNDADALDGGEFATIYLAPYDYHRVHFPVAGTVSELRHIPGELFSVNAATVTRIPRLFARNERLACRLETTFGTVFIVLVGALNVGSITTPWTGEIRPTKSGVPVTLSIDPRVSPAVKKGDLLGWFNMGSTVVILFPPDTVELLEQLSEGQAVCMGESIGRRTKQ